MSSVIRFVQAADGMYLMLLAGLVAQHFVVPTDGYIADNWLMLNAAILFVAVISAAVYVAVRTAMGHRDKDISPAAHK